MVCWIGKNSETVSLPKFQQTKTSIKAVGVREANFVSVTDDEDYRGLDSAGHGSEGPAIFKVKKTQNFVEFSDH